MLKVARTNDGCTRCRESRRRGSVNVRYIQESAELGISQKFISRTSVHTCVKRYMGSERKLQLLYMENSATRRI